MSALGRVIPLCLALFSVAISQAAELRLELGNSPQLFSSAELLADPRSQSIVINDDVSYKRSMRYHAMPIAALLGGIGPDEHIQMVASDGFAAELPASLLLNQHGSTAWLAIEDPQQPWPSLGNAAAGTSAGPFYLVWQNPQAAGIGPEQWPFRIVRISKRAPLSERYPQLLPSSDASHEVQAGFAQFQRNCLACHRLNGGGDAQLGPDLNIPYNPTEYFKPEFLRRYIRDPQRLRRWPHAKMPAITPQVLTDRQLDQVIAYLSHMAARKVTLPTTRSP